MDDYYSPHPTMILNRPVALGGFWGSQITETVVGIASVTGIPIIDVERRLEHHVGMRLQHYVDSFGLQELIALEEQELPKMIPKTGMPPLIALQPLTLMSKKNRSYLRKTTDMYYLEKSIFVLFANILEVLDRSDQTRFFHIPVQNPRDLSQISHLLKKFKLDCRKISNIVEANMHPLKVAQKLHLTLATA